MKLQTSLLDVAIIKSERREAVDGAALTEAHRRSSRFGDPIFRRKFPDDCAARFD